MERLYENIEWLGGDGFTPTPGLWYVKLTNGHIYTVEVKQSTPAIHSAAYPELNSEKGVFLESIAEIGSLEGVNIKFFARVS